MHDTFLAVTLLHFCIVQQHTHLQNTSPRWLFTIVTYSRTYIENFSKTPWRCISSLCKFCQICTPAKIVWKVLAHIRSFRQNIQSSLHGNRSADIHSPSYTYTYGIFTPKVIKILTQNLMRIIFNLFFIIVFALGGSPTPHPISSRPHFVCKFSRHGSSSPVTIHLAPSLTVLVFPYSADAYSRTTACYRLTQLFRPNTRE